MVGLSMALTIAICLGGFAVLYGELDPFTRDFVSADAPEERPRPTRIPAGGGAQEAADVGGAGESAEDQTAPTPTPGPTETPEPTPTPAGFQPSHQLSSPTRVNLREGPGTRFPVVIVITLDQPLQYLDESQPTENPDADGLAPGQLWMKFRTEDGFEGWVREIDVGPYDPNA